MSNLVTKKSVFGTDAQDSFIGVACWPDEKSLTLYFRCSYYPRVTELRDQLGAMDPANPPTPEEMSTLIREMAEAIHDMRDAKRFRCGYTHHPTFGADFVAHTEGKLAVFSSMSNAALQLQSSFYQTVGSACGWDVFRSYDRLFTAINQCRTERIVKYPIKFITEYDETKEGFGWTE